MSPCSLRFDSAERERRTVGSSTRCGGAAGVRVTLASGSSWRKTAFEVGCSKSKTAEHQGENRLESTFCLFCRTGTLANWLSCGINSCLMRLEKPLDR